MQRLSLFVLASLMSAGGEAHPFGYHSGSHYAPEPRIVVSTKDCSGAEGVAAFAAERIYKIQEGPCRDPDAKQEPLYQVLLTSSGGSGRYDVISVDAAGAAAIARQLEENRRYALGARSP